MVMMGFYQEYGLQFFRSCLAAGKLDALEEFRIQKEDLMAKFAALEEQLKQQEEEHSEIIYNLERRAVVDKDR